jgi:hypothetical protein
MKILRLRRGYTTNSSAYTEWLPPPPQAPAAGQTQAAPGAPATAALPTPGTPATPAVAAPAPHGVSAPPPSPAAGNSLVIGGLVAALVAVFVGERVLRRRKRRPPSDADE